MPSLFARDLFNNPDKRGDVIGVELDDTHPVLVNAATGKVTFHIRYVTAFNPTGSSAQYAVASKMVEVTYDAMQAFLTKLMTDAKQQNVLNNGTISVVSGPSTFPHP